MEKLSSRENALIRQILKLNSSAKERKEKGLLFLEGLRLCTEAIDNNITITHLLISETAYSKYKTSLLNLIDSAQTCVLLTDSLAKQISETDNTQGVFVLCKYPNQPALKEISGRYILLENLQDPGNMGTIIRCAEAFGITAVVISKGAVDPWSPKVIRSAMGSSLRIPIIQVDSMPQTIKDLRNQGVAVYGAALNRTAKTPTEIVPESSGIGVVIGNEGNGLTAETLSACNSAVFIPMTNKIESLNAASAATILMWEIAGKTLHAEEPK